MIKKLNEKLKNCQLCNLCENRNQVVFGHGNLKAKIVFIGEAPGREEDEKGIPFVGRSGKLLTDAIESAGFKREDFYITNINKCRPPDNRTPKKDEIEKCLVFLKEEINIINPEIICLVGATPAKAFLGNKIKMNEIRGKIIEKGSKKFYVVFHPAYVLRGMKTRKSIFYEDINNLLNYI